MEHTERIMNPPLPVAEPYRREEGIELERVERELPVPRDRVRWGPIWAGLLTTLSVFLLLALLLYALGGLSLGLGRGNFPNAATSRDAWMTGIVALISFFIGGWVTGYTSWVRGTAAGLINGFCVWALATVMILVFSSLGLGVIFGTAGNAFDQFIALNRGSLSFTGAGNINPDQIGGMVRDASLWAFIFMALSIGAAMLGGWVGSRGPAAGRVVDRT